MSRLAKDFKVLFVNSIGMRVPSFRKDKQALKKILRKLRSIARFVRKADNGMFVMSPVSLPLLGSALGRKINSLSVSLQFKLVKAVLGFHKPVFYVNCPPAFEIVRKLPKRLLIYERTDLFEEMPGVNKSYIAGLDDELATKADLVLYVNKALWEQGRSKNENSLLLGHGVDYDLFANAVKNPVVPEDIAGIPRPIVGFFGDISNKTMDVELLESTARSLDDMSFVIIGPVSADVSGLRNCSNVHFLGQKPYRQIPHYGSQFDVAIMPWNRNKWIEFCNPIKLKEYLALGKPVVTTYYPEIEPYADLVYVAEDCESFASHIRTAVGEHDPAKCQARQERIQEETWDSKVGKIREFILKHTEHCDAVD